jgi:hypothetical protein
MQAVMRIILTMAVVFSLLAVYANYSINCMYSECSWRFIDR